MVIDGSDEADRRIHQMLHWDVNNGIARRSWARNKEAIFAISGKWNVLQLKSNITQYRG